MRPSCPFSGVLQRGQRHGFEAPVAGSRGPGPKRPRREGFAWSPTRPARFDTGQHRKRRLPRRERQRHRPRDRRPALQWRHSVTHQARHEVIRDSGSSNHRKPTEYLWIHGDSGQRAWQGQNLPGLGPKRLENLLHDRRQIFLAWPLHQIHVAMSLRCAARVDPDNGVAKNRQFVCGQVLLVAKRCGLDRWEWHLPILLEVARIDIRADCRITISDAEARLDCDECFGQQSLVRGPSAPVKR